MVRLKSRYILFEVLYPESANDSFETRAHSVLALHRPTSDRITAKVLIQEIRTALQSSFGDYGASTAVSLSLKYFSNKTSTGILRVARENYRYIVGALTMITTLGGEQVIIKCTSVSGSIKKCEDRSIRISRRLMEEARGLERSASVLNELFANDGVEEIQPDDEEE